MPPVTHATNAEAATRPLASDPAARIRRLIGSSPDAPGRSGTPLPPSSPALATVLARFDAPADIRVRGGLGSGRRTLAAALAARRGWRVAVDDLDVLAAPGARPSPVPDVEILCLRTAPCRHEESWIRRARRHPLLVVATGVDDDNAAAGSAHTGPSASRPARPLWTRGLPTVDARDPEHRSVDGIISFVERALDVLPSLRVARLEIELERLAVDPDVGELAEAALCALEL